MARVFKRKESWWIDYYYLGRRYRQKIGAKRKAEDALAEVRTRIATGVFVPPDKRRHEEAFVRRPVLFAAFIEAEYLPWSKVEHSTKHHDVQK